LLVMLYLGGGRKDYTCHIYTNYVVVKELYGTVG